MKETTSMVVGYILELYGVGTFEQLVAKVEDRTRKNKTLLIPETN